MAKTFDQYVRQLLKLRVPHRLLFVFIEKREAARSQIPAIFVKPATTGDEDAWIRVCFYGHSTVTPELTFALLTETADEQDAQWGSVVVAPCSRSDRAVPSELEASSYLNDMRTRILSGGLRGLMEFDRRGHVVEHAASGVLAST